MGYLYLTIAFLLNAAANIFLKLGARHGFSLEANLFTLLVSSWQFFTGLILFAINIVFYFFALRVLPLSVAYPIMVVMSFLIVHTYAVVVLHEPVTTLKLMGYVIIFIGIMFIVGRTAEI